jgi:hypothetical protein
VHPGGAPAAQPSQVRGDPVSSALGTVGTVGFGGPQGPHVDWVAKIPGSWHQNPATNGDLHRINEDLYPHVSFSMIFEGPILESSDSTTNTTDVVV